MGVGVSVMANECAIKQSTLMKTGLFFFFFFRSSELMYLIKIFFDNSVHSQYLKVQVHFKLLISERKFLTHKYEGVS